MIYTKERPVDGETMRYKVLMCDYCEHEVELQGDVPVMTWVVLQENGKVSHMCSLCGG